MRTYAKAAYFDTAVETEESEKEAMKTREKKTVPLNVRITLNCLFLLSLVFIFRFFNERDGIEENTVTFVNI